MEIDSSSYKPNTSILFVFIGSNHKNLDPGHSFYDEKASISSYLPSHTEQYLKKVRDEVRVSLDSLIWQDIKTSKRKMNENLVKGIEFGGRDERARYLPAVIRFSGRFFNEGGLGSEGIHTLFSSGHHALIIDGLHGLNSPVEPLQLFNCPLEFETLSIQKRWRDQNTLTNILKDYIQHNEIKLVFDLTSRKFYQDLIDWYEIDKTGVDVFHVFFEEYAGDASLTEFAQLCKNTLFKMSEQELCSLQPESTHSTPVGNYIFTRKTEPPKDWARELSLTELEVASNSSIFLIKLNDMVDNFERNMRNLLDHQLKQKQNWFQYFENEPLQTSLNTKINDYLRKYPMLSKEDFNILDFCTIFEYQKIVKKFWKDIFEPIFRSESEFKRHIENINELRNNLKHNRLIHPSTQKLGEGSLLWFEGVIEKYAAE